MDNSRYRRLLFHCDKAATLHGFSGYFESRLYPPSLFSSLLLTFLRSFPLVRSLVSSYFLFLLFIFFPFLPNLFSFYSVFFFSSLLFSWRPPVCSSAALAPLVVLHVGPAGIRMWLSVSFLQLFRQVVPSPLPCLPCLPRYASPPQLFPPEIIIPPDPEGMFSWFPLWFPLKNPIAVQSNTSLEVTNLMFLRALDPLDPLSRVAAGQVFTECVPVCDCVRDQVHFWRVCSDTKVWYEWAVAGQQPSVSSNISACIIRSHSPPPL